MKLQDVKLVISDMDGTLLNKDDKVSDDFFKLERELRDLGVQFVAASGRQFYSIQDKLALIKDDIYIVAENGAYVRHQEEEIIVKHLNMEACKNFIEIARTIDDAHIVLCGKKHGYVEDKNEDFLEHFKEYYQDYRRVDDLTQVTDDEFLKVAIYSFGSSRETTFPAFKKYGENFKVKVSGQNWLDISSLDTDKGSAIAHLQEILNVRQEETMVFGDYDNDIEMLSRAKYSYAMANASTAVKEVANFETRSNNERGVETVLEQLLKAKKSITQ